MPSHGLNNKNPNRYEEEFCPHTILLLHSFPNIPNHVMFVKANTFRDLKRAVKHEVVVDKQQT